MTLLHPGGEPKFWSVGFRVLLKKLIHNGEITMQTVLLGRDMMTLFRMCSASLIAGFAADTNNWRYAVVLLARYFLVFSIDINELVYALNLLRIAGAKDELKLAASHFLRFGPIEPLVQVVKRVVFG